MKMACVENIPPLKVDSEMEEGEIVDDLSDISSEEEFLLRQRLQVLENYNNVLERKKAKRSSVGPGTKHRKPDALSYDLSEISANELEDYYSHATTPHKPLKLQKRQKTHHRQKRRKLEPIVNSLKPKDYKKKNHYTKKKLGVKIVSESSDESEDEYRNRRRKLADAVVVNKNTNKYDKSSLSERLQKMLCKEEPGPIKPILIEKITKTLAENKLEQSIELSPISSLNADDNNTLGSEAQVIIPGKANSCELIDLCTDEDSRPVAIDLQQDVVDSGSKTNENEDLKKVSDKEKLSDKDSDEDLELLRQHALKTKNVKAKVIDIQTENKTVSEDEDSDTAELRLICLKSALLKKAIERKQKQKLKKRLSQSSNLPNDFYDLENNTDIESVDMDIGSDAEEKTKENPDGCVKTNIIEDHTNITEVTKALSEDIHTKKVPDDDELEDDEDLLRAKLLTSLSKNLPNLVNPNIIDSVGIIKDTRPVSPKPPQAKPVTPAVVVPEEKRFIITLGESDSEGEHEATKNLTKMHMKLSEQVDFQQRLDIFLKSTRLEVEKTKLPDVVQQPAQPKKTEKFVAKAVKHLPKSEQIEYKNLVKRMAELEKIKQARQSTINLGNNLSMKDTLKPRNTAIDATKLSAINSLEEKIKTSRKHIAEESAKMLKLKEEATKLFQKYKIVATELRNIKTAIALNKKQTRSVQNCLTKIRLHHQNLLKSSITSSHSKINNNMLPLNKIIPRLQKENNPINEELNAPVLNKITKVKENNRNIEEHKNPKVLKPTQIPSIQKNILIDQKDIVANNTAKVAVNQNIVVKEVNTNFVEHHSTKVVVNENNLGNEELKKSGVHRTTKLVNDTNLVIEVHRNPVEQKQAVMIKKAPLVIQHPRLSVELDVTSNKKVVKMPDGKTDSNDKIKTNTEKINRNEHLLENKRLSSHPVEEKGGGRRETEKYNNKIIKDNDYKSPLDAFGSTTWEGDPNAILCPFEVGGDCKDGDCIYLHTQPRST